MQSKQKVWPNVKIHVIKNEWSKCVVVVAVVIRQTNETESSFGMRASNAETVLTGFNVNGFSRFMVWNTTSDMTLDIFKFIPVVIINRDSMTGATCEEGHSMCGCERWQNT